MFIGIDPGNSGAIAIIYEGMGTYDAYPLPVVKYKVGKRNRTMIDIPEFIWMFGTMVNNCNGIEPVYVCLERVGARPDQGVTSMFNFGFGYGVLTGISHCFSKDVKSVTPQKWKKTVLSDDHTKGGAIEYVNNFFPYVNLMPGRKKVPHDGMADAMCIAQYCKIINSP